MHTFKEKANTVNWERPHVPTSDLGSGSIHLSLPVAMEGSQVRGPSPLSSCFPCVPSRAQGPVFRGPSPPPGFRILPSPGLTLTPRWVFSVHFVGFLY